MSILVDKDMALLEINPLVMNHVAAGCRQEDYR